MNQSIRSPMSLTIPQEPDYVRCSTPNQRLGSPRFERNDQGEVEYTYEIDVSDFRADEIKVKQSDHTVTVDASCSRSSKSREESSSCSRSEKKEYHKTILLPQNADLTHKLETTYVGGKLILKIPIISSPFAAFSGSPRMTPARSHSPRDKNMLVETLMRNGKQIYSEKMKMDPDFSKDDIKINIDGQIVSVNATQKRVDSNGCVSTRNFNSEHKFPTNVDLDQLQADWSNGELLLSAPYKF